MTDRDTVLRPTSSNFNKGGPCALFFSPNIISITICCNGSREIITTATREREGTIFLLVNSGDIKFVVNECSLIQVCFQNMNLSISAYLRAPLKREAVNRPGSPGM